MFGPKYTKIQTALWRELTKPFDVNDFTEVSRPGNDEMHWSPPA